MIPLRVMRFLPLGREDLCGLRACEFEDTSSTSSLIWFLDGPMVLSETERTEFVNGRSMEEK